MAKIQASSAVEAFKEFSDKNKIPTLKVEIQSDKELNDVMVHSVSPDSDLISFLEFCKAVSVSFFTYVEFTLDEADLEEIIEDDDEEEEVDEDEEDEELGLSPKATEIIVDSVKRQVDGLRSNVGQVGCLIIFGHKDENVFKFMIANDWYELFVELSKVFDDLEENGPEILSSDEIIKFNKEMGIRESRESIMKRRETELETKKELFFTELSKDRIFLNAKNISLRNARAEKMMPGNLRGFLTRREAVDGGVNSFMQRIEKLQSEGKDKEDIAKILGVTEALLKKYLTLG